MQGGGLVQRRRDSDLVQAVVQVLDADAALVATVPLIENAVQVGARGVLAAKGPPDVHDMLLVDRFLQSKRLVGSFLLSAADTFLDALVWQHSHRLGHSPAFVGVGGDVSLVGLLGKLGCGAGVVASEDLVCPLGVLELLGLLVGHQHRRFRLLALSVIELDGSFFLGVVDGEATGLLKAVLTHGADVGELHGGVEAVLSQLVTLGPEVDVREAALVRALLADVHL